MTRLLVMVLAVSAFLFATTAVRAETATPKAKGHHVTGMVKSVAEDGKSFVLLVKEKDSKAKIEETIQVNDATKYQIGKNSSTKAEVLKVDAHVSVMRNEQGVAVKVEAWVKKHKEEKTN